MPATLEDVRKLVESGFEGSDATGVIEEKNRIMGTIRWNGFGDLDAQARNALVTKRVRDILGLKGMNVGLLVPLTEREQF